MQKTKLFLCVLIIFLLLPLSTVDATIIRSGQHYSLNLPMQTSFLYGRRTHWLFLFDKNNKALLLMYSNDTLLWMNPIKISDCGSSNDYDVYPYSPYLYIVIYQSEEAGTPLYCKKIVPRHNLTFIDEGMFEIVSGVPEHRYSNPSILSDSEDVFVTYHDFFDMHLYLTIYNKTTTRISNSPTGDQWYSKIITLVNGTKMILYSDGQDSIRYKLFHKSWLSEEKVVIEETLRWKGSWSVNWVPDDEITDLCAGLTYQGNDTKIKYVPYSLKKGWAKISILSNTTHNVSPTIGRLLNGSHMVCWEKPETNEVQYSIGTSYSGWNTSKILPMNYRLIDHESLALCFVELDNGFISLVFLTNEGVEFRSFEISTGAIYKKVKKRSWVMTGLKLFLIVGFVLTIGMRMMGISKWEVKL